MRRFLIAAVAILSLATAGLAYGDPVGGVQPACADITGGGFSLNSGLVGGSIDTADGTSCRTITYTLYVIYTGPGGKQLTRSQSVKGSGTSGAVRFSVRIPPSVTSVDTYVTSSDASGELDRGPDSGTIPVTEGSGGGTGYN